MRRVALAMVALGVTAGAAIAVAIGRQDGFPHAAHAGLFPTCDGCHAGISGSDSTQFYTVRRADCLNCHDGSELELVDWAGPSRPADNLSFSHEAHASAEVECLECHQLPEGTERMEVGRANPEPCVDCHGEEAHLADDVLCDECHRTLSEAPGLSVDRIGAFPRPPSHETEDFLSEHASLATDRWAGESCAVCHARQSCTRCHLDPEAVESVAALEPDERVASLVAGKPGYWPEPVTHEAPDWVLSHASAAEENLAGCASCHTVPSCASCHGQVADRVAAGLPVPRPGRPTGAQVEVTRIPGHTSRFATEHGAAAAADLPTCATCHVEQECRECHTNLTAAEELRWKAATAYKPDVETPPSEASLADAPDRDAERAKSEAQRQPAAPASEGEPDARVSDLDDANRATSARHADPAPSRPGYHPANFVLRHGAEAYSAQTTCANCHTTEVFCRQCHARSGVTTTGAVGINAFHDAQPDWLIAHGQAARLGMEECASCHQQSSCLRCHSARTGWRVNPHGPGFDPERLADRSKVSCLLCHFPDEIRDIP